MQLFSLLAQVAPAGPAPTTSAGSELIRTISDIGFVDAALFVVILQVITILSYWVAGRVMSGEHGTLGAAVQIWLLYLVGAAILGVAGGLAANVAFKSAGNMGGWAVIIAIIFLFIVIGLGIPMKSLGIGVFRSLGFLILSLIVSSAGTLLFFQYMPTSGKMDEVRDLFVGISQLPPAEQARVQRALMNRLQSGKLGPVDEGDVAADRSKTIEQRFEAIQAMHQRLEARQAAIKPGDTESLENYNRDLSRYEQLLKQLQIDAQAAKSAEAPVAR